MRRKRPVSTALAAAPEDGDGTGGSDGQEVNDNSDDNAGPSVAKKNNGRELGPTVKLPTRPTKKKQETDELTRAMISFMGQDERGEKEQDEIDLALSAIGIRLKKSLNEEQIENAMDEINGIVTRHIKNARAKRFGIFRPSTSSDVVQQQQQQQPVQQMPAPPPLQSMGGVTHQYSYDENDGIFANL